MWDSDIDQLRLGTQAGGLVLNMDESGNVGIGTTTPAYKLHVNGSSLWLTGGNNYGNPNSGVGLRLYYDATNGDGHIWSWDYGTGNAKNIIIDWGNVGIGTATPGAKLEVAGQVKITGGNPGPNKVLMTVDGTGLASWEPAGAGSCYWTQNGSNVYYNSGNVGIGTAVPLVGLNNSLTVIGTIINETDAVGNYNENLRLNRNSNNGYASLILGGAHGSGSGTGVGQWSLYTIPSTAPQPYALGFDYNGAVLISVLTNGNVGIGTTSPESKLEVAGQIKITGGIPGPGKVLTTVDGSGLATWETPSGGGGTSYWTASDDNISNTNSGGVGIGVATPAAGKKLHIEGGNVVCINQEANPTYCIGDDITGNYG